MPGESGVTVVTDSRVFYTTRGCGRIGRPAFPTPSVGRRVHAQLGRIAPRGRGLISDAESYLNCHISLKIESAQARTRGGLDYPFGERVLRRHPQPSPRREGFQCRTVFVNPLATNRGRSHGNRPAADLPVRMPKMPKLPLLNPDDLVAIDIHTHAEEPCGMHADDGYDDFQAQMAEYFKSPNKHPPTVPETAAYYRAKKIAAVIFPVDAERETGFRRYS